uniref:Uncharacterized protein n=1 Tax=Trichuris muris TaxID=70415 RepID=A0A5S6QXR9_TRIMR
MVGARGGGAIENLSKRPPFVATRPQVGVHSGRADITPSTARSVLPIVGLVTRRGGSWSLANCTHLYARGARRLHHRIDRTELDKSLPTLRIDWAPSDKGTQVAYFPRNRCPQGEFTGLVGQLGTRFGGPDLELPTALRHNQPRYVTRISMRSPGPSGRDCSRRCRRDRSHYADHLAIDFNRINSLAWRSISGSRPAKPAG